jgi:hypothetical protein
MSAVIAVSPLVQFTNASGAPLVGGLLYTYLAGTSTPTPTWADQDQIGLNTNPIVLDARGECRLWLEPALQYRLALYDSLGALIWSVDDISGALNAGEIQNTTNAALGDALVGVKQPFTGTQATTQHAFNAREIWLEDFTPSGSNWAPALTAAIVAAVAAGGARILLGRGTKDLGAVVYLEGDDVELVGDGPGATHLRITHTGAEGISAKKQSSPGRLSNIAMRDFTIESAPGVEPSPEATELIHGEAVDRLEISNVVGIGGRCLARFSGCSNVKVDEHCYWDAASSGLETDRAYAIVDGTSLAYVPSGERFGRHLEIHCAQRDRNFVAGVQDFASAVGVRIDCGIDIKLRGWLEGARIGVHLVRALAANPADCGDIDIELNTRYCARDIVQTDTIGDQTIQGLRIAKCKLDGTGNGVTGIFTRAIELELLTRVNRLSVVDNDISGHEGGGIILGGATDGAVVARNQIRGVTAAAYTALLLGGGAAFTDFAVVGNVITEGGSTTGIGMASAGVSDGAINGNVIGNQQTGIAIGAGTQRVSIWGNQIDATTKITNAPGTPSNSVQTQPVSFRAFAGAASPQTFANTTPLKILFNTEAYDHRGTFDAGGLSRWTPATIGNVLLSATVHISTPAAAGVEMFIAIYKNGAELARGNYWPTDASAIYAAHVSTQDVCSAVADYYEVWIGCNAVGTKTVMSNAASFTWFAGTVLP